MDSSFEKFDGRYKVKNTEIAIFSEIRFLLICQFLLNLSSGTKIMKIFQEIRKIRIFKVLVSSIKSACVCLKIYIKFTERCIKLLVDSKKSQNITF